MTKSKAILVGILVGVMAEAGALMLSFSGTNLFHGGHPNAIANVLLPYLGIADRLAAPVPRFLIPALMIASLIQFPLYGALLGRDHVNRRLSRITRAVLVLHVVGAALAFYGVMKADEAKKVAAQHGACVRANAAGENASANANRITELVVWRDQSKRQLVELRAEKLQGATFKPDPEEAIVLGIAKLESELKERWAIYRTSGGVAKSPEELTLTAGPCGK